MRTLVTGPAGFVGTGLFQHLLGDPAQRVMAAISATPPRTIKRVESIQVSGLAAQTDWRAALVRVDCVVHLAARPHGMCNDVADPLAEFRRINVDGGLQLARQSAETAVRRFVYVSSIKANGESTSPGRPFRGDDLPRPQDAYGISTGGWRNTMPLNREVIRACRSNGVSTNWPKLLSKYPAKILEFVLP